VCPNAPPDSPDRGDLVVDRRGAAIKGAVESLAQVGDRREPEARDLQPIAVAESGREVVGLADLRLADDVTSASSLRKNSDG
jgi:hypothetical protein